jgi:hypothetical protein
VHLTSYGQELAAEFIAKGIRDHFPSNFDKILNETNDTREDPAPLTDTTP